MDTTLLGLLFAFTFTGAITPGPNNIILMSMGVRFGFKATLPYIFGVAVGFGALLTSAILGLGVLVEAVPALLPVISVVGAVWLLWLAWGFLKAALYLAVDKPSHDEVPPEANPLGFVQAVLFQWVNPKGLIFAFATAGAYAALSDNLMTRILIMNSVFLLNGFIGNMLWAGVGGTLGRYLSAGRFARALNCVIAIIIVVTAGVIVLTGFSDVSH